MCGPSQAEQTIAGNEQAFSQLLASNYQQNFGAQSQVLSNLNSMLTPIATAGPDQQGFGPQELAALNTQAGEGVGQNYAKAQQSLNNIEATRTQGNFGGGNEKLISGARNALNAQLSTSAANEMSNEQLGITRADYAQGRNNWQNATSGLQALANAYNPNAIAGETSNANSSAFGEADKIQQEKNQEEASIIGGVTSLAMDAASFGTGFASGGFTGGLNALTGGSGGGKSGGSMSWDDSNL